MLAFTSYLDGNFDDAAMMLGSVTGQHPQIAWAAAPWFGSAAFPAGSVPTRLPKRALRTLDGGTT